MARIRTIKPEFFEDESLAKLPPHDRLLFIGIWLIADKNGILEDRPTWIKAKVFPYENGDTVDVSRMLPRLVSGRYLIRYTAEGRNLIAVRNFTKHQRITGKEGLSDGRYPLPPMDLHQETQTGHIGDTHGTHLDAQEQGTGNREQGKERIVAKAPRKKSEADILIEQHPFKISGPKRGHRLVVNEIIKILGVEEAGNLLSSLEEPLWPDRLMAAATRWHKVPEPSARPRWNPSAELRAEYDAFNLTRNQSHGS
jgi:hypothetical protein